ncbi:MAG: hypothetical protein GC171_16640 [Terrimonas sp.]|nr:hypothetical protein [Terrimonas sp.]
MGNLKFTGYGCSLFLIALVMYSCAGGNKLRNLTSTLAEKKSIELATVEKIDAVRTTTRQKTEKQLIDDASGQKILDYTDSLERVTKSHLEEDSVLINSRIRHSDMNTIAQRTMNLLAEARVNLENITIVNEILSTNTFSQFNTASLFEPGQYTIADNLSTRAIFSPVVNEMVEFAAKFPGKKLTASFIILGYADAEPINTESQLSRVLQENIRKDGVSSSELNLELSRLRAESVGKLINRMVKDRTTGKAGFGLFSSQVLPQGRGEEFPDKAITDYRQSDERRRIVKLFWNILPF